MNVGELRKLIADLPDDAETNIEKARIKGNPEDLFAEMSLQVKPKNDRRCGNCVYFRRDQYFAQGMKQKRVELNDIPSGRCCMHSIDRPVSEKEFCSMFRSVEIENKIFRSLEKDDCSWYRDWWDYEGKFQDEKFWEPDGYEL